MRQFNETSNQQKFLAKTEYLLSTALKWLDENDKTTHSELTDAIKQNNAYFEYTMREATEKNRISQRYFERLSHFRILINSPNFTLFLEHNGLRSMDKDEIPVNYFLDLGVDIESVCNNVVVSK